MRKRDVDRLFRVLHAVNERIVGIELLARGFQIVLDGFEAQSAASGPTRVSRPQPRNIRTPGVAHAATGGHHGVRVFVVFQFALEDFRPEVVLIVRQALQAQPGAGVEVAIRNEVAGLVGAFLGLGAFDVLIGDDAVFGVEFILREHGRDDFFLELVGQLLRFGLSAAALLDHGLPRFFVLVLVGGLGHVLHPAIEQFVIELARFHHLIHVLLLLAGDFPDAFQIIRGLECEGALTVRSSRPWLVSCSDLLLLSSCLRAW